VGAWCGGWGLLLSACVFRVLVLKPRLRSLHLPLLRDNLLKSALIWKAASCNQASENQTDASTHQTQP